MKTLVIDQSERIGKWVAERVGGGYVEGSYALGVEEDGELIVGVMYNQYYPGASIAIHFASIPGKHWARPEWIKHAFIYPFDQLKVHKLVGYVREDNIPARKTDEHLGFTLETRIKNACAGGDILVYTMTREQCRFVEN